MRVLGGVHLHVRRGGRAELAAADLTGGRRPSLVARREPRRCSARECRRRCDGGCTLRDRTHLSGGRRAAGRAVARRRRRRRRLRNREVGGRAAVCGAQGRAVIRADARAAPPSRQGGANAGGLGRRAAPVGARGSVGCVRARPRRALRARARRGRVRGGQPLPGGAAGSRVRRRRRRARGGPARRHARSRRAGPALLGCLRRVPRRADRPGKKSLAFRTSYGSLERTLTDEEATAIRSRIVDALAERFGAVLRA